MTDAARPDETYHFILSAFVERGQAPHYTEIAARFQESPEDGRKRLHELMAARLPNWLFPDTDLIASFAPFNNLPTQYRISVDGEQRWFAQCGLESLATTWMFPGKRVAIDAPCLDCGEPLHVEIRDGVIERANPEGIAFYVDLPVKKWYGNIPFA
jgi:Alkylmercury lyase